MAFYFEVRDDSPDLDHDWEVKRKLHPYYYFYRSKRYATDMDMLLAYKMLVNKEKITSIPLFFKNGLLLEDTDDLFCELIDEMTDCCCCNRRLMFLDDDEYEDILDCYSSSRLLAE